MNDIRVITGDDIATIVAAAKGKSSRVLDSDSPFAEFIRHVTSGTNADIDDAVAVYSTSLLEEFLSIITEDTDYLHDYPDVGASIRDELRRRVG